MTKLTRQPLRSLARTCALFVVVMAVWTTTLLAPAAAQAATRPSGLPWDSGVYYRNQAQVASGFATMRGRDIDVITVPNSQAAYRSWMKKQGAFVAPAAPASAPAAAPSSLAPSRGQSAARVQTVAVLGDSITEAGSDDGDGEKPGTHVKSSTLAADSWVYWLDRSKQFVVPSGYARSGARTDEVTGKVEQYRTDWLIIMLGTNDLFARVPTEQALTNITTLVRRAEMPPDKVVLAAVPPIDAQPHDAAAYNAKLKAYAAQNRYHYVDAMARVRTGERFAPGMAGDGVHPSGPAAELIGADMAEAVSRLSSAPLPDSPRVAGSQTPRSDPAQAGDNSGASSLFGDLMKKLQQLLERLGACRA